MSTNSFFLDSKLLYLLREHVFNNYFFENLFFLVPNKYVLVLCLDEKTTTMEIGTNFDDLRFAKVN